MTEPVRRDAELWLAVSRLEIQDAALVRKVERMLDPDRIEEDRPDDGPSPLRPEVGPARSDHASIIDHEAGPEEGRPGLPPTGGPPDLDRSMDELWRAAFEDRDLSGLPALATVEAPDRPVHPPLIPHHRARATLAQSIAHRRADGPVDVGELVRRVATGTPMTRLPRSSRRSSAAGVQLLVDRGPALQPFRADVAQLEDQLRAVLTEGTLRVVGFDRTPHDRTWDETGDLVPYFPRWVPRPGTTVLVVCDLGIGRPGRGGPPTTAAEWVELHRRLAAASCAAVFLVPYHPRRWPDPLRGSAIPIVWWDHRALAPGSR